MNTRYDKFAYISTGDKTAMYTLRVACDHIQHTSFGLLVIPSSYHIQNLSNKKDLADKKAQLICEELGILYKGGAEFELNEIKRKKKEDSEEQQRRMKEAAEQIRQEEWKLLTEMFEKSDKEGVLLMGKYEGYTPAEVAEEKGDEQYLYWLAGEAIPMESIEVYSAFQASAQLAKKWTEENPEKISEFIGEKGEKVSFVGKLTKQFWTRGQFPTLMNRFLTEEGNIVVVFSASKAIKSLEVGQTVEVQATVKKHEHSYYEKEHNDKITIVARPKIG